MAAILCCGPRAALSHECAANLWRIADLTTNGINVSVPKEIRRRRAGLLVHRRTDYLLQHITQRFGIPVTNPIVTLFDLATILSEKQLVAALNEADKRNLVTSDRLLDELAPFEGQHGVRRIVSLVERTTLAVTDSELERHFLRLIRSFGLPAPQTGKRIGEYKVDFFWPELGLIVEADGLRYHRTPSSQSEDRVRDQINLSKGLETLRYTHAQIKYDPAHVRRTLTPVIERLARQNGREGQYLLTK
jgi:very-short-patch-repair endonuclease